MLRRRLLRDPVALFGLAVILVTVAAAVLAPQLAPYPPDEQFFDGLSLEGRAAAAERASSGSAPTCSVATCSRA